MMSSGQIRMVSGRTGKYLHLKPWQLFGMGIGSISSTCEYPVIVTALLDFLAGEEANNVQSFGPEGLIGTLQMKEPLLQAELLLLRSWLFLKTMTGLEMAMPRITPAKTASIIVGHLTHP